MNMRDPMSQMAAAQKLSIPQLQEALRNGTINPQVGQIVLASKIKQDKDAKMAMAAQAPKQPPVAQQNLAYGAGVDALPSNLPVEGMAQGGIVSFGEGGPVAGYSQEEFNALPPETQEMLLDQAGVRSGLTKFTAAGKDVITLPGRAFARGVEAMATRPLRAIGVPIPYLPERYYGGDKYSLTPEYDKIRAAEAQTKPNAGIKTQKPAPVAATEKPVAPAKDQPSMLDSMLSGSTSGSSSNRTKGVGTGIGAYQIKPYTEAEAQLNAQLASEINPATGKEFTYDEIAARRKEQQKAAGIDFDLYGNQKEELEGMRKLSDTRSRLNEAMPYFALAERLGQAPKPGETAITALSSALAGAGKTKAEIDDKEEARKERIGDKLNALAVAQNQFNAAQFSGNEADLKEARNRLKESRLALTKLGIDSVNQQNDMAKTMAELNSRERISANQIAATRYAADRTQNTVMNIAKIIKRDNPGISDSEAIKRAYETSNPGFGAIDQRDVASQRTTLTKELENIRKDLSLPIKVKNQKINAIQAKIDALGGGSAAAVAGGDTVESYLSKGYKMNPT